MIQLNDTMKKRAVLLTLGGLLAAMMLTVLLAVGIWVARQHNDRDQKWLQTVEKMVGSGQTRISTPSAQQVTLLKQWAGQNGFAVGVTQTPNGYRCELIKCKPVKTASRATR